MAFCASRLGGGKILLARWFSKQWVWAALAGTTVAIGLATGRPNGEGPPKLGTTISLNIDGKGERQFKVIKSERQPDGTYLSDLRDTKTGDVITLVDRPGEFLPPGPMALEASKAPESPKNPAPKAKPPAQQTAATTPDPQSGPREKERRPLMGRLFGDKNKTPAPPAQPSLPPFPGAEMPAEPEKKPGLLGRVFGSKKPTGPSMPSGPVVKPSPSAPPAVIPTPPGGVTAPPGLPPFPGAPGSTAEPPRVMPMRPGPMPIGQPMPSTAPTVPAPAPLPIPMPPPPTFPAPSVPPGPIPTVPLPVPAPAVPSGGSGFLPIPIPQGGTSSTRPLQLVVPAGFIPAGVAYDRDVQPFVVALQTKDAPSARLIAAKGLAEGRHASSDGVKAVLFQAAQMDPCAEVRAACIDHLCKLGYFNPHFLGYIQTACEDADPMVSAAAKTACAKMIRQQK